jgi:predicted secreted Zn-dependent protease
MLTHTRLAGPICALISVILVPVAQAKPITNYTHYLIAGESAESLYRAMLRRGPHVGGGKAYASTKMVPEVSAKTVETGGGCRIQDFKVNMTFTIRLPQLKKSATVDATLRKSFSRFYEFAKKHEETHRTIWLKCAAEAEARVNTIKAKTCPDAEARARHRRGSCQAVRCPTRGLRRGRAEAARKSSVHQADTGTAEKGRGGSRSLEKAEGRGELRTARAGPPCM